MTVQELSERLWTGLRSPTTLLIVLALLGGLLLLSFLLPQSPVAPSNEVAFARWLAQIRPTLGRGASWWAALGWLSLRTSWGQRLLLALLSLVLAVRSAALIENWTQLGTYARLQRILICAGITLLLLGWGTQTLWGWIETEVTAWPEEPIALPERGVSLPPLNNTPRWTPHSYGTFVLREDLHLGLEAQAWDKENVPVPLLASARGEPQEQLRLSLSEQAPDGYFALPTVDLIFRASLQQPSPDPVIQVQIYRSASDELLTETTLHGSGTLFANDVRIQLESMPLPYIRVIYNPGAPLTALGWIVLLTGGTLAWYHKSKESKH